MELEAMVAGGDVGGRPDGAGTGTVAKGAALLMPMSRICQTDLVVHRTLGMGRFGRVRLVQHKITGTTYALKMMGRRLVVEAGQESHVRNEVTVMKRISHPFCTSLFATFVDSRYFYMLLEVTSGGELFRVLEQAPEGRLSNAASCFYAANVVCAFEYLHKQKIIYRDLKPENLMVDAHGFLKIVDFGFAKRVFGRTYTLCGTVDYLAPETVSQQGHGFEVDLWALGVLAYEMLVGCPPFEGENKVGTLSCDVGAHTREHTRTLHPACATCIDQTFMSAPVPATLLPGRYQCHVQQYSDGQLHRAAWCAGP
jgi:serine/threonine protein kinase